MNKDKTQYKQIQTKELTYLWYNDYYDGALAGILLYQNQKYWFECFEEEEDHTRNYFIYQLTPEQLQFEEECHEDFKTYVGTHTDYSERYHIHLQKHWTPFYEKYDPKEFHSKREAYLNNPIVGWFNDIF